MEKRGVFIDLLGIARIDLQIPEQVRDDISEQDEAGDCHDGLLPDRRLVEAHGAVDGTDCNSAHAVILVVRLEAPGNGGAQSGAKALKTPVYRTGLGDRGRTTAGQRTVHRSQTQLLQLL